MKIKALTFIASILFTASMITSCLDQDKIDFVGDYASSIRSFEVDFIRVKKIIDNDSITFDSVSFSKYPFSINQSARIIENKDSMPVNTQKDRVVVKIKADTDFILYTRNDGKDTVWTEKDTLDFTNNVMFRVVANAINEGMNKFYEGRAYTVKINVHNTEPDTMQWNKSGDSYLLGNGFGTRLTKQKAAYANNTAYVFGEENGTPCIKYATIENGNMGEWKNFILDGITDFDTYSAISYDNNVYFQSSNDIYVINNDKVELCKNKDIITFYKDYTANVRTYTSTQALKHNPNIQSTVIVNENMGTTEIDTAAIVSLYLPRQGKWKQLTSRKGFACPDFENISMLPYDGKLVAFGGDFRDELKAFETFYFSDNRGLDWKRAHKCMYFPQIFEEYYNTYNKNYSTFVDLNPETGKDNYIWIIWEDGKYSKGRINRLGFKPKEWN